MGTLVNAAMLPRGIKAQTSASARQFPIPNRVKNTVEASTPHVAPAIERVEQAHGLLLVVERARLHHRADQHLQQSAAHGIYSHRQQDAQEGAGHKFRQNSQQNQSGGAEGVSQHHGCPVTDAVHETH